MTATRLGGSLKTARMVVPDFRMVSAAQLQVSTFPLPAALQAGVRTRRGPRSQGRSLLAVRSRLQSERAGVIPLLPHQLLDPGGLPVPGGTLYPGPQSFTFIMVYVRPVFV